ncbi:MAG: hypothetical protein AAF270_15785 [Pseudomonadota bacterium]
MASHLPPRANPGRNRLCALMLVCLTAFMAGCGAVENLLDSRQTATNQTLSVEESTLSIYLADIELLLSDSVAGDRAWRELQLDYERAPTTTNQLRLAMALATPGHAHTDLARADGMLTSLLLQPELLLSDERLLASVHLGLLRSRISAESVARQANNSATRSNERELAAAKAQLSLLQQDNAKLRSELTAAEDKLRAITLIERSIREREDEPTSNGSPAEREPNNE